MLIGGTVAVNYNFGELLPVSISGHVRANYSGDCGDPNNPPLWDGSRIHAFQSPDGGFSLVFLRGSGDCPSGCIERRYWYFETS